LKREGKAFEKEKERLPKGKNQKAGYLRDIKPITKQ